MTIRSIALFAAAALAEIGGVYLIWVGLRDGKGPFVIAAGALALLVYGVLAASQPSDAFGRVLAAYGGVFVAGSLLWAMIVDGYKPDRYDVAGATICLAGVGVIMYMRR
jgi:small multidrug resistance family-3 protein